MGGAERLSELAISVDDLRTAQAEGAQIVDVRVPVEYMREHIPGSINLPYTRQGFADASAYYLKQAAPVVLVADGAPRAGYAARELRDAGFTVHGVLDGGFPAWKEAGASTAAIGEITADELETLMQAGKAPLLVDVREAWEFQAGHIDGSRHMPLSQFVQLHRELPNDQPTVFVCASGSRSGEAVQFLYRLGHRQVYNLVGGMLAWRSRRRGL